MPDNDLIRNGISGAWGKPYAEFQQWQLDPLMIVRSQLKALKKDLQRFGAPPIRHLQDAAGRFASIHPQMLQSTKSMHEELDYLTRNRRSLRGHKRGMNIAKKASLEYLLALPSKQLLDDYFFPVARSYVHKVYDAQFKAPVRRMRELSQDDIDERFQVLDSMLSRGMDNYAQQIVDKQDVKKLRLPLGYSPKKVTTDDELDAFLDQSIRMKS